MLASIQAIQANNDFSGSVFVKAQQNILADISYGYANRSDQLKNNRNTRYGIASGCKLFTAIAICQLVEKGQLKFESKLSDCLEDDFPNFDQAITVHHLLTHTAGIPDYFDEELMVDFEELWIKNPMYQMRNLTDFLPLFKNQPMKLNVGERFHYNNAGYILLGLIIEKVSQQRFQNYVEEHIFSKVGLENSGYYLFDQLPSNTAQGYIDLPDGNWKTNIYSLPVKGGSDGGAFVTAPEMATLWEALMSGQLLNETYTKQLLNDHVQIDATTAYGYGVWIEKNESAILKYHVMGYDPGVSFHSAYYPKSSTIVVVCSNQSGGAYEIAQAIEERITEARDN